MQHIDSAIRDSRIGLSRNFLAFKRRSHANRKPVPCAGEEAPTGHVFAGLTSQIVRQGVRHVDALIVHTCSSERQPAKARLEDAVANVRVPVHDSGAEKGRHCSHRAPRVRGGAADERVVPEIAAPGITGGETVMRHTQLSVVVIHEDEKMARMVTDFLGDSVLMYSSDYPHAESRFPESTNEVLAWKSLGDEVMRKMLWDNAARCFGEP